MRSRAQFKAHPIHPALIPFPIAFLTGALLFDVLAYGAEHQAFGTTAAYLALAGIAAGLAAAIPGAIDYFQTVPPDSSAKARATRHAAGNLAALAAFAAAFAFRTAGWQPTSLTLLVELAGGAALAYAGYLGGTLVTRNLISVDHRYAQAGKWQEARHSGRPGVPLVVGRLDDLKENQMKLLHVNGRRIVLGRTGSGYHAFEDRCTHRGGSLAGGVLVCGTVQCLWHGSQFDVATGGVRCGPAKAPIATFAVEERPNGEIVLVSPPG
jgi:nitrite reductase/ring-hydroxylating ferredoxin subunit/uncharacterized membrane protein